MRSIVLNVLPKTPPYSNQTIVLQQKIAMDSVFVGQGLHEANSQAWRFKEAPEGE